MASIKKYLEKFKTYLKDKKVILENLIDKKFN